MHNWRITKRASPIDSRWRLRVCLVVFLAALLIILGRAVQLEWRYGAAFREEANRPLVRRVSLPGVRGRILARDGVVLAEDSKIFTLAVHYRYLEEPCNRLWLRRTARSRLTATQRSHATIVADEENRVLAERQELAKEVMALGSIAPGQWESRSRQIQTRVERIAASANRGREEEVPLTVAEETQYHVMVEDIPLSVVAEVERQPERYHGLKIVERSRRNYPGGSLAAHVLGHLGPADKNDDRVGQVGIERQYESLLAGHRGEAIELTDHSGRILSTHCEQEPGVGRDLVLTIDSRLQAAAETLLDQAIQRREITLPDAPPGGGAIVVLDVHDGAILAAASAPRFRPTLFAGGASAELNALLTDPRHPLFDRVSSMAIAPGSVFKVVTSIALLESGIIRPDAPMVCRGYLDSPDRWRCEIFVRHGHGHGEVDLAEALAQSCNVYFLDHARRMGTAPLVDWAHRLGFESFSCDNILASCIGQGKVTATPLQIARLMAAVANGGQLVQPHLVSGLGLSAAVTGGRMSGRLMPPALARAEDDVIQIAPPQAIEGLQPATLQAINEGLRRAVNEPTGTAYGTVHLDEITVAGKTGTAQTGAGRPDHAWFAGYVPAEEPRWAFVVVLEHAGDSAIAAGPVARRLVQQMLQLGLVR